MKIAIVFDKIVRPDTTGIYCQKALAALGHTVVYCSPLKINGEKGLSFTEYTDLDPHCALFLQIDDDLPYPGPIHLKPNAYWCIDTHRFQKMAGGWSRKQKAQGFERIFCAQKDGVGLFTSLGFSDVHWLPLAFDPQSHFRLPHPKKKYDWCFVGNLNRSREEHLQLLAQKWPNGFVGRAYGLDAVHIYNQSKIIFNYSIGNDINMRVFEGMACGGLLITNRVDNGEEDLFGEALVTYSDQAELLDRFEFYLRNEERRQQAADQQYHIVQQQHTYTHRMQTLVNSCYLVSSS